MPNVMQERLAAAAERNAEAEAPAPRPRRRPAPRLSTEHLVLGGIVLVFGAIFLASLLGGPPPETSERPVAPQTFSAPPTAQAPAPTEAPPPPLPTGYIIGTEPAPAQLAPQAPAVYVEAPAQQASELTPLGCIRVYVTEHAYNTVNPDGSTCYESVTVIGGGGATELAADGAVLREEPPRPEPTPADVMSCARRGVGACRGVRP